MILSPPPPKEPPPRKRGLKVDLPDKNAKWNDKFLFFRIIPGIALSSLRRTSTIPNVVGSLGSPLGFNALRAETPIAMNLLEELISKKGALGPTAAPQGMVWSSRVHSSIFLFTFHLLQFFVLHVVP